MLCKSFNESDGSWFLKVSLNNSVFIFASHFGISFIKIMFNFNRVWLVCSFVGLCVSDTAESSVGSGASSGVRILS